MAAHMKTVVIDCSNLDFFYMTYDDRHAPKLRHSKGGAKKGVITDHSMRIPSTKDFEAYSIEYTTMEWRSTTRNEEFGKLSTSDQFSAEQAYAEAAEQNENDKKENIKKASEEKHKIQTQLEKQKEQLEKQKEEEAQKSEEAFQKKMASSNQKFDQQLNQIKSLALRMTDKDVREKKQLLTVAPDKKPADTMKAMQAMKRKKLVSAMKAMKKGFFMKAIKKGGAMKAMKKVGAMKAMKKVGAMKKVKTQKQKPVMALMKAMKAMKM